MDKSKYQGKEGAEWVRVNIEVRRGEEGYGYNIESCLGI